MAKPTIVLIHGAWHGSWCWDKVATSLRENGFEVVVPDLPGHEQPGSSARIWNRTSDYVSHVEGLLDDISRPTLLVGHSMGGLIVQRVLEQRDVDGAVLVASVPRRGAIGAVARLLKRHPGQVIEAISSLSLWPMVATDERARELFFAEGTDEDAIVEAASKLQNESFIAFLSMLARWPRPRTVNTPITVVAATQDQVFTLAEQHDLAQAYGQQVAHEIDAGHDIMLEPAWPELVEMISIVGEGIATSS